MCNCIEQLNEQLRDQNTEIITPLWLGKDRGKRAYVWTEKAVSKKRGGPSKVMASFCPFCGVRYEDGEAQP